MLPRENKTIHGDRIKAERQLLTKNVVGAAIGKIQR